MQAGSWVTMSFNDSGREAIYRLTKNGAIGVVTSVREDGRVIDCHWLASSLTSYNGEPWPERGVYVADVIEYKPTTRQKTLYKNAINARRIYALRIKAREALTLRFTDRNRRVKLPDAAKAAQGKAFSVALSALKKGQLELMIAFLSSNHNFAVNYWNIALTVAPDIAVRLVACAYCSSTTDKLKLVQTIDSGCVCPTCAETRFYRSKRLNGLIKNSSAVRYYSTLEAARGNVSEEPDYVSPKAAEDEGMVMYKNMYIPAKYSAEVYAEQDDALRANGISSSLSSYHGSARNFKERNVTPEVPCLGVELEVYCEYRSDAVSAARYEVPAWNFETDGSLSSDYGFEIISQPLGVNEWRETAPRLLTALLDKGACAYTQPDSGKHYGIHVNIARRHLTPLQEARMLMFMHDAQNLEFIMAIAQRAVLYGGSSLVPFGSIDDVKVRHVGGLSEVSNGRNGYVKKPVGRGKYSAINMHERIAEFRIFQSTLHHDSFMKNLEFVWALVEWTSTKAATGTAWLHTDFVRWLGSKPANEQKYPHLFAYLRKPSYMGKGFPSRVHNKWAHLLSKTTTKSLDVVSGDEDQRLAA